MPKSYSTKKLSAIYGKYCRQRDWISNPIATNAMVALWQSEGCQGVDLAIQLYERARERRRTTLGGMTAIMVGCSLFFVFNR